ncbi:hypothetical protein LMG28614_01908 [Paraburkholderia ultramafica]|uniref:Lipoprotein n=1 Tax=Paraburkholderia ultramafica TaxID=1544867 RepID=A0A6S7BCL4_9BURK|nr:hypothetical protein [Paraburkholderia ultramafica]CAB3784246.1 hypothetical protein LMG28614_01908 [Paraburkholderia ultramafica]
MKIRILSIACVTTAAALLAACTAVSVSRNSGACEQLMRSKLAETSSDTLRVANRAAAIRGSRVVVEGSIEHVMTASEVAAATPASAAPAASAPRGAAGAMSVAAGGGAAAAVSSASAVSTGASEADASLQKPVKPKTVKVPAAAECTFDGETLNVFRWLAPARLAAPPDEAASEAAG